MFRNAIKFVAIIIGLILVVWGVHGLYAYFYRLDMMLGASDKLFGEISLPGAIVKYVSWMSVKGFQSWFIPGIFIAAGFISIWWQSRWVWRR